MKGKQGVTLLVPGCCLHFRRTLQKMMHHPHGTAVLHLATMLKTAGTLLLVYKLVTYLKTRDFMNR